MKNQELNTFGKRLKFMRKKRWKQYKEHSTTQINPYKQFSICGNQDDFGDVIGVGGKTILRWENDQSLPDINQVDAICKALKCPFEYLIGTNMAIDSEYESIFSYPVHTQIIGVHEDILLSAMEDRNYLSYLNYFMDPKRTRSFYKHIENVLVSDWIENTEIEGINGELKELVVDAFHRSQLLTIYKKEAEQKKGFITELKWALYKDRISLGEQKTESKFQVKKYIDKEYLKVIDTSSYEKFIKSLADNYFKPLKNNMIFETQKKNIADEFLKLYVEFVKNIDKY